MITIGMVSLGCPKNRVDGELIIGKLKEKAVFTGIPEEADVIIVNTCGFIESAKQESIDTILEMAELKKDGNLKGLIVTGCLSERYRDELVRELPEVDAFLGVHAYAQIAEAVEKVCAEERYVNFAVADTTAQDFIERGMTTPGYTTYIKISEGCSNRCTYCAIPYIRGGLKSRTMEDIEQEVRYFAKKGVSEFILVAQDTTDYGADLYGKPMIVELLDRLAPIEGVKWIRLLYAYPEGVTDELLACMLRHDNIVKYIDIPIQHFSTSVLHRMHRRDTRESVYDTVKRIRAAHPDFAIRTTLIAGFPGETEEDFELLKQGIADLKFDKLGVFAYSQEDGTPAARMDGQLPEEIKEARAAEAMELQQPVTLAANLSRVGKVMDVLVEERLSTGYAGRSYLDAPDIDGTVYIKTEEALMIGEYYSVRIVDADEYDLIGELA